MLSGPELDKIVEELKVWYLESREYLIKLLTKEYPYGSAPLTPEQQYANFMAMNQQDWENMSMRLSRRYRGQTNADEMVQNDLADFMVSMERLHRRLGYA